MQTAPDSASLEQKPRQWPVVIGVLGILWGGLGVVSGLWSLVAELSGAVPAAGMNGPLERAVGVVGLLVSCMLVFGGIQLLRRKPMGVQLVQAWIPLGLILGLVGVGLMVKNREAMERAFREGMENAAEESEKKTGRPGPQMPEGFASAMWASSVACGGLGAIIPPLVPVFFVFGRRGREAMAEWSKAGSPWQLPQA